MEYEKVKSRLIELDNIQQQNRLDSKSFIAASREINDILYRYISIKDFAFIGKHLGRELTIDDEARLVAAASKNLPLTDAITLPSSVAAAFVIRKGRREKGLSQADLANEVGMTQSQIAKIENVSNGINLDVMQQIMNVLGRTFIIKPAPI